MYPFVATPGGRRLDASAIDVAIGHARVAFRLVVLIVSRHDETVEMDCFWLEDGATLLLNQELQRPLAARAYAVSKDSGHAIIMRLTAVSQGRSVPSYSLGAHIPAFVPTMRSGR